MMAPRNAYPACLLAKNDRISEDRLDLLHQSHVNPLGLHACPVKFTLVTAQRISLGPSAHIPHRPLDLSIY